jgi:hypothetical protein
VARRHGLRGVPRVWIRGRASGMGFATTKFIVIGSNRIVIALVPAALAIAGCTGETLEPWEDPGTSDELLDPDLLPELELRLEDDAIASLRAAPREYVPATIVYDGRSYGPVGVRIKGQNSFQTIDAKPSLRIKVDKYVDGVTFFDLKDLTLNNMVSDPSLMHEPLAYLVAREAGLPASRANHALLTVNGEYYGVYANVETVKKRMIGRRFDDNSGPLFEATDVDFTREYVDAFELDAGPDDRSMLWGLADALAIASPDDALAAAGAYIDIAHFQRYWAMTTVIGQFDGMPYSVPGDDYFLYADPTTGRLWLIPWGMDETFFAADFSPLQIHSVLARRCMESPACFQGYVDQTWELMSLVEALGLDDKRAVTQEMLAPHLARDRRKPYSDDEVAEGQTQLRYFIRGRRETLSWFLPPPS